LKLPPKTIAAFHRDLIHWFKRHRRSFPWRANCTPYRVWISELMLQQTRADTVVRYFQRFMKRFPTLHTLARAPRQDVLKQWEGLGYYARARHAQDAAKWLVGYLRGEFPRTRDGLLSLPGIGEYTAAAIGSLALGLDLAVVDGNVARVLSRVMAYSGDVSTSAGKKKLQSWANGLLIPGKAGLSNESLMELGALVCAPRNPACHECPLPGACRAFATGNPERYPVKRKRAKVPHKIIGAGVVIDRAGRILIAQRKETSMLGGLWEFPGGTLEEGETIPNCIRRELKEELGIETEVGQRLLLVHHAYSHFTIELHAHWARMVRGRPHAIHCADFSWVRPEEMKKYPFSKADLQIVQCLGNLVRRNCTMADGSEFTDKFIPWEKVERIPAGACRS
jgi:A/G-specific adenine glycosylase